MKHPHRVLVVVLGVGSAIGLSAILLRAREEHTVATPVSSASANGCQRLGDHHWWVSKAAKELYFQNSSRMNEDIVLRPENQGSSDLITELRIAKVAKASPMHVAGFRVDDQVLKVNGLRVSTIGRAMGLANEIKASKKLTVQVDRQGKIIDYQFDFE